MVRARGGSWPAASNPHRPDHARNPAHAKAPGLDTPGGGRRSARTRRARLRHSLKPNHGGSRPSARAAASLLRKDPQGEVAPGGVTVQPLGGCASISPGPLSPDYFGSHIYPPTPVERRVGLQTFRSAIVILGPPSLYGAANWLELRRRLTGGTAPSSHRPGGIPPDQPRRPQPAVNWLELLFPRGRPAVNWLELLSLSLPPGCQLARAHLSPPRRPTDVNWLEPVPGGLLEAVNWLTPSRARCPPSPRPRESPFIKISLAESHRCQLARNQPRWLKA